MSSPFWIAFIWSEDADDKDKEGYFQMQHFNLSPRFLLKIDLDIYIVSKGSMTKTPRQFLMTKQAIAIISSSEILFRHLKMEY